VFQFSFKSFVKSSREYVDKVDREQNDPLSESIKHNDIEQLVLVLESLQNEIALSKANEKKAKVQVKEIMKKSLILQTKLDEVTADFEILKATK
jgi:pyruvate/oxaloacetate carboxyltransferase